MEGITSLGHVAIRVKDVERSLDFYVGKLGFEEMFRLDKEDGSLWIVYLRVTDDQYVELFPGGEGDRSPRTEAIGYNHMCFTVDNLDRVIARLAERGVALSRPKKVAIDRNAQAWVEDPDGNRIELMEMSPDCLHFEALARMKARR
jgi:lactoylglutathione lyase